MNKKAKVISLVALCIVAFTLQGQEILPVSIFNKSTVKEDNFGLEVLCQDRYSLFKQIQSTTNVQNYQANLNYKEYSSFPEWSKCVTLHSAQEFLNYDFTKLDLQLQQFNSFNTLGLKSKFAGVEVCYNIMKFSYDYDESNEQSDNINQYGIGFGFPSSESLRLFGWLMHTDSSNLIELSYTGYKAELAKRVTSNNQIIELGVGYEYNELPEDNTAVTALYYSEYFPKYYLFSDPNTKLSAYFYASSLQNFYLEPYFMNGHSPNKSPLLLANRTAQSLLATFVMQDWDNDYVDYQNMYIDAILSLNFGKYLGFDGQYQFTKDKDEIYDEASDSSNFIVNMRLTFCNFQVFRIIGFLEYLHMDGNIGNYEDVNYGCYGILQLTNHLNSTIFYKINNRWNRDQDFSDFHNYYNTAGVTLSIRL